MVSNYTDIEKSKKLSELGLSSDTADMCLVKVYDKNGYVTDYRPDLIPFRFYSGIGIPCWSVGALLELMPKHIEETKGHKVELIVGKPKKVWSAVYFDWDGFEQGHEETADTLMDVCYNMTVWLLENGYINHE